MKAFLMIVCIILYEEQWKVYSVESNQRILLSKILKFTQNVFKVNNILNDHIVTKKNT